MMTTPARDAGLFFWATGGKSDALVAFLKNKTGGARPARRLTFVRAATKVSKNAFLLAEGISFASFLRHPIRTELNKPARYRGPPLQCDL